MIDEEFKHLRETFLQLDRLDVLAGIPIEPVYFPCKKCGKDECKGRVKCKGYGAYRVCLRMER